MRSDGIGFLIVMGLVVVAPQRVEETVFFLIRNRRLVFVLLFALLLAWWGGALYRGLERIVLWSARVLFPKTEVGAIVMEIVGPCAVMVPILLALTYSPVLPPEKVLAPLKPFCPRQQSQSLLILVHGWNGDSAETWKRFPELLCTDTDLKAVEVLPFNYPSVMENLAWDLGTTAQWLSSQLERRPWEEFSRIAIIAHSIGGLISRDLVITRRLKKDDRREFVVIVEIATPHSGTYFAFASALGIGGGLLAPIRK